MANQPELKELTKPAHIQKQNEESQDTFKFVASKEVVDRDDDLIIVSGIDTAAYLKNPVILYGHNTKDFPIGKAANIYKQGDELIVEIEFSPDEEGQKVKALVENGFLSALSISFMPKRWERVDNESRNGWDIKECELLEISVVTVPANQEALKKAYELIKENENLKTSKQDNYEVEAFIDRMFKAQGEKEVVELLNKIYEKF